MKICCVCELAIVGQSKRSGDNDYHQFCYELWVAELAEDIGEVLRSSPDYEEVSPGRWRRKDSSGGATRSDG